MGSVVPLFQPENYKWVQRRIRTLWNQGNVIILPHAQQRMLERGLDMTDIQHIIRRGIIVEHSFPKDLWRYKIVGKALDNRKAAVVIEVDSHSNIVVTVIGGRTKS